MFWWWSNLSRPTNWSTGLKFYLDIRTGSQMHYFFFFSFWSVEKHIAPRLRHVLAMSAPGRPEGANTRTTRNRHLRVLTQFATKWSLTLQVLSYVGGKNCKVFRLPKFWRMPKPGRGGWVKNKVSRCDGVLLLWSMETQKEWDAKFRISRQMKMWGCCLERNPVCNKMESYSASVKLRGGQKL
jgi:hypothetical protein